MCMIRERWAGCFFGQGYGCPGFQEVNEMDIYEK